jgi:hypothetical protein
MRAKDLRLILAFVVVLALGLVVGYALKPSVEVRVCDPADLGPLPPLFDRNSPSYRKLENDPVIGPVFRELEIPKQLECWQPVARIGPFDVYVSPKTAGYIIGEDHGEKTTLMQETADGRTELTIYGPCHEICVTLTYDASTGKRIRSSFEAHAEGGLSAPLKWLYMDNDGDGRFDAMVDHGAGVAYEQKGLEWIEIRRQERTPNPGDSGRTDPVDLGDH